MRSLRTRITVLTLCAVIISLTIATAFSVLFIRNSERREARQLLLLLCETGERNLDYFFNNAQETVEQVSRYTEKDLDGLEEEQLQLHVGRVRSYFEKMAYKMDGLLTYYYRIDPEISDTVKGFWYTNLDGNAFLEHDVTDITLYDTEDTSSIVWFTVPKKTGKATWLPPYITENLSRRVISYNVPIYWKGTFVGVIGIEIDYSEMAEQVESIRLYRDGYAFVTDEEGRLFFHPHIDVAHLTEDTRPEVPEGLTDRNTFIRYTYNGVEKQGAWLPLTNGMRLYVAIPTSETEGDWTALIRELILVSFLVLLIMSLFIMIYTRRITKPLEDLTEAAEQLDRGNYNFSLDYARDDEVGRLTSTFKRLAQHTKEHISDLNKRAFVDALTSVKNKGAFNSAVEELQQQIDVNRHAANFAIGIFDCDNLKKINDSYGHDKGDVYLKTACRLICRVFQHSPVFRIGGDEFAVILKNDDFQRRDKLVRQFEEESAIIDAENETEWKQVQVAMGIAVYDPRTDIYVIDTVKRADQSMYANKQERKGKAAK